MLKQPPRSYSRSNLFLVRLWPGPGNSNDATGDSPKTEWAGKVQRIVNGETQLFTSLQELAAILETMLSSDKQQSNQ